MELVLPSQKFKNSFLEAAEEFQNDSLKINISSSIEKVRSNSDFNIYIETKLNRSKGLNLPEGYVPATDFWLIDNGEYIGSVSIRHRLSKGLLEIGGHIGYTIRPSKRKMGYGTNILRLALIEAKKLGIDKALVTCDKTNIGSSRIIEKNNGILENEVVQSNDKPSKLRYWITIK